MIRKIFPALFLHVLILGTALQITPIFPDMPTHKHCMIRILLEKKMHSDDVSWDLYSNHGFNLSDSGHKVTTLLPEKTLHITVKNNHFYINNKKTHRQYMIITPNNTEGANTIKFDTNEYKGTFILAQSPEGFYLINHVDLEEYVFSVVRWESWPGWPHEVNKVVAIIARTYVIEKLLQARNKQKTKKITTWYDIGCTNKHQTYKGTHQFEDLRKAVDETAGMVIAYNKKPILAMYDICCGGIIPAHTKGCNFKEAPYLAREYACTYCKDAKIFNWTYSYTMETFADIMRKEFPRLKTIRDIKITTHDKAGKAQQIKIKSGNTWHIITGNKLYALCKDIRSFCYTVQRKDSKILFNGVGYGHHMGLCQWGARQMVKEGWEYKSILRFYYPGTHFMKIELP